MDSRRFDDERASERPSQHCDLCGVPGGRHEHDCPCSTIYLTDAHVPGAIERIVSTASRCAGYVLLFVVCALLVAVGVSAFVGEHWPRVQPS